ncbi:MAG: methyltransferase domain-containing protein, partial [Planctomycetaceae bacterium]|nr:methyltransferase domain-containing protein [Planctomycetaceae bacterium]
MSHDGDSFTGPKLALADPGAGISSVGHLPDGRWRFDNAVTKCFTDMLERSIPDLATLRKLTTDLGSWFVQSKTDVLDLGCSRGDGIAPFLDRFGADNRFIAFDCSEPMVQACRERHRGFVNCGLLDVRHHDLREGLPPLMPSLILSTLTLQFVSLDSRQRVVADAFRILRPGGAMIVVEKTLGSDAASDRLLVDTYHAHKRANGYSTDEVEAKRQALQNVLVPLTA